MRDHRLLPVPSVVGAANHGGTLRTAVPLGAGVRGAGGCASVLATLAGGGPRVLVPRRENDDAVKMLGFAGQLMLEGSMIMKVCGVMKGLWRYHTINSS
jgi:hypothetical protein